MVVDNETAYNKVNFYNLDGDSYSNCYQIEVKYELIPRLEATLAYRYNDVKTTINGDLRRTPLTSRYKGLVNLSYFTNLKKWQPVLGIGGRDEKETESHQQNDEHPEP